MKAVHILTDRKGLDGASIESLSRHLHPRARRRLALSPYPPHKRFRSMRGVRAELAANVVSTGWE